MILVRNCINKTLIEEYNSELTTNSQKYESLFKTYISEYARNSFKDKNVYAISTTPQSYNYNNDKIEIQIVIEKYNTDGVSVGFKINPEIFRNDLIKLRNTNKNFRELIKLAYYIEEKYQNITDMDFL